MWLFFLPIKTRSRYLWTILRLLSIARASSISTALLPAKAQLTPKSQAWRSVSRWLLSHRLWPTAMLYQLSKCWRPKSTCPKTISRSRFTGMWLLRLQTCSNLCSWDQSETRSPNNSSKPAMSSLLHQSTSLSLKPTVLTKYTLELILTGPCPLHQSSTRKLLSLVLRDSSSQKVRLRLNPQSNLQLCHTMTTLLNHNSKLSYPTTCSIH